MRKSKPRASSVGASPSKESLSSRSTWQKSAKRGKKVRYNPIDSDQALQQAVAAHDPYLEKSDAPEEDRIDWAEPATPAPTPLNPGDHPEPEPCG